MLLKLLALPVSLPMAGFRFCLEQVVEMAEQELMDEEPVREALLLLTLGLEDGEVSEEEYTEREAALLRRLREIRAYKQAKAHGVTPEAAQAMRPIALSMAEGAIVVELHEGLTGGASAAPDGRGGA